MANKRWVPLGHGKSGLGAGGIDAGVDGVHMFGLSCLQVQGLVLAHDGDTDWGCCVCMNSPGAKHALVWLQGLSAGSSAVVQAGDTSQEGQHKQVHSP